MKENRPKGPALIQLPRLLSYRRAEFAKLSADFDLVIAYSQGRQNEAYGMDSTEYIEGAQLIQLEEASFLSDRIFVQHGLVKAIRKAKPSVVFVQANVRYASFWAALLYCKLFRVPLVSHGQGLYRYPNLGVLRRRLYCFHAALATNYVCYNELSKESMIRAGVPAAKLSVARNSLVNRYPRPPSSKCGAELGILFVGRLRARSRVEELVESVRIARNATGLDLELHVVGGGEEEESLRSMASSSPWVHVYGAIYDERVIAEISESCFIGAYPGDAGLSVVHMMSLSLPPVVHSSIELHMGPEPDYVEDNWNGFLFDRARPVASLAETIARVAGDRLVIARAQEHSFLTYERLVNPSFGDQLLQILKRFCRRREIA